MGIISKLLGMKSKEELKTMQLIEDLRPLKPKIDLEVFSINNSILNKAISSSESFFIYFNINEVLDIPEDGIEIGLKDNLLDYVYINLESFKGEFCLNGDKLILNVKNSPQDIIDVFGEPYWTDRSDDEIILFYEYKKGFIELQFEFSDSIQLSYITLMCNGILSTQDQREAYNVSKQWPPN
ncbi:MAG: hypothetical protein HQK76_20160 [Desulfobacterales bacterium]|nr:hypothetical protein [Desulfobacterales bacterium]